MKGGASDIRADLEARLAALLLRALLCASLPCVLFAVFFASVALRAALQKLCTCGFSVRHNLSEFELGMGMSVLSHRQHYFASSLGS